MARSKRTKRTKRSRAPKLTARRRRRIARLAAGMGLTAALALILAFATVGCRYNGPHVSGSNNRLAVTNSGMTQDAPLEDLLSGAASTAAGTASSSGNANNGQ